MRIRQILATTALAVSLGLGAPAFAQTADDNQIDDGNNNIQNEDSLFLSNLLNDFADDSFNQDNDGNNDGNVIGSNLITAVQVLSAVNSNSNLDEVVDMDGEDATPTGVGYHSGNNSVRGNAFAAYAGILNQAWNTGINANTQAATNIAAQGTVNFATGNSSGSDGGNGD